MLKLRIKSKVDVGYLRYEKRYRETGFWIRRRIFTLYMEGSLLYRTKSWKIKNAETSANVPAYGNSVYSVKHNVKKCFVPKITVKNPSQRLSFSFFFKAKTNQVSHVFIVVQFSAILKEISVFYKWIVIIAVLVIFPVMKMIKWRIFLCVNICWNLKFS